MELIKKISTHPVIFAFLVPLTFIAIGFIFFLLIWLFGLGSVGIIAGIAGIYSLNRCEYFEKKLGKPNPKNYKWQKRAFVLLIILNALMGLTPWIRWALAS